MVKSLVKGNWNVSPLREAKALLGVLKQEGLTGNGLIAAFEKYSIRLLAYSRSDMAKMYRQQTGRELSDYILIQRADKVVRGNELEGERAVLRRTLARCRRSKKRKLFK